MIKDSTTKRHDNPIHHRILAVICAVAIAMLQCAVLVSVDWDEVYAADKEITVEVTYNNGVVGTKKNVKIEGPEDWNTTLEDETKLSGIKVSKLYKSEDSDVYGGSIPKDAVVITSVDPESESDKYLYHLYYENSVQETIPDKLTVTRSKDAVSFSSGPSSSPSNPTEGDTIEISYTLVVDDFYKKSDEYEEDKDTKLNWSGSGIDFGNNKSTTGTGNHSVTGKVTRSGNDLSVIWTFGNPALPGSSIPISASAKKDIKNATIASVSDQEYTGRAITPTPSVTLGGKTLNAGTDFTYSYANNIKVGNATIKITGIGKYKGEKSTSFKIVKKKETETSTTKPTKKPTTKSTTEKKPSKKNLDSDKTRVIKKEIAYYNNGKEVKPKFVVKYGDKTLKEGKDYTIEYSNNKNVGNDAKVTIKGKGDYTGEITRTFSITKKYTYNNNGGNGGGGHYPTKSSTVPPVTTGSTVPTETYAPDRSITVREVHLGQAIEPTQESQQNDSTLDDVLPDDQDNGRENPIEIEDPTVDFGPAASSAAVAVAACGLGAVGRIRKYRSDMGPVNEQIARALGFGGDGSAGSGDGNAAKSDAGKGKEGKKLFGRSAEKAAKDGAKAAGAAAAGTQAKKRKLPIPRRKDH